MIFTVGKGVKEKWNLIKQLNESDFVEEIGLELPYILLRQTISQLHTYVCTIIKMPHTHILRIKNSITY